MESKALAKQQFFSGGEWRYAYVAIGVLWVGALARVIVGALIIRVSVCACVLCVVVVGYVGSCWKIGSSKVLVL